MTEPVDTEKMKPEYDFSDMKGGIRGKYYKKYREGHKVVVQKEDGAADSSDAWDMEIARDSKPGGRLECVLERVRKDINEDRTKPLDEPLDNS